MILEIENSIKNIHCYVWLGLGTPKQDYLGHILSAKYHNIKIIGIGAALDYLSGVKKEAPLIVQKLKCEWLYRLIKEPIRLWERYLIGNVLMCIFLIYIIIKMVLTKIQLVK